MRVAERGATPQVSRARRRALRLVGSFTSPLLPDDYLEMVNPLWTTRELRGRVERVEPASASAFTVTIKPGTETLVRLPVAQGSSQFGAQLDWQKAGAGYPELTSAQLVEGDGKKTELLY